MAHVETLQCYNKGCGIKFKPEENSNEACSYHPGAPVFHDALKGWSCCRKRSTDFTEFLNIPGCTKGLHSNEKPPEPEPQPKEIKEELAEHVVESKPVIRKPIQPPPERPSLDTPLVPLSKTVGATLKQALDKQMREMKVSEDETKDPNSGVVEVGTSCKNKGCTTSYEGEHSDVGKCLYHSGVPIFHEGMKYWSCCQRKTSDFDNFLSQEGCTTGKHVWIQKEEDKKRVVCRHDWHQTGSFVIVSVFAKVADPEKTSVQVNQVKASISIVFDGGKSHFSKDLVLRGVIDPSKSSVKLLGSKVEINLKKAEPGSWTTLELPPEKPEQQG